MEAKNGLTGGDTALRACVTDKDWKKSSYVFSIRMKRAWAHARHGKILGLALFVEPSFSPVKDLEPRNQSFFENWLVISLISASMIPLACFFLLTSHPSFAAVK